MGGSIDEYKKRLNKSLKQPKKNKRGGGANKPQGPMAQLAKKKRDKLKSEVGTNKTKTKSVLGITDFAKTPKPPTTKNIKKGTLGARNRPKPKAPDTKNIKKTSRGDAITGMPKPKPMMKKAKKGPIVTKEQLEKSGLSLRDYMNMMQGKTRRDKKGPEMSDEAFEARRNNPKKLSGGGKLRMVEKDGKQVPFFAADGKGKMMGGGMSDEAFEARRNNPKKMMGGGMLKPKKKMMGGGMTKIKYRGGGIVKQGVRPTKYI